MEHGIKELTMDEINLVGGGETATDPMGNVIYSDGNNGTPSGDSVRVVTTGVRG